MCLRLSGKQNKYDPTKFWIVVNKDSDMNPNLDEILKGRPTFVFVCIQRQDRLSKVTNKS